MRYELIVDFKPLSSAGDFINGLVVDQYLVSVYCVYYCKRGQLYNQVYHS